MTNRDQLSHAFDRLVSSEFVEDCMVEPAELQLRFVAPPERAADLVEKIYMRGGLVWCQRSPLRPSVR
jgi:hypothetical protein